PARPNACASVLSDRGRTGAEKAGWGGRPAGWRRPCNEARSRSGQLPDRTGARLGENGRFGKRNAFLSAKRHPIRDDTSDHPAADGSLADNYDYASVLARTDVGSYPKSGLHDQLGYSR